MVEVFLLSEWFFSRERVEIIPYLETVVFPVQRLFFCIEREGIVFSFFVGSLFFYVLRV